MNIECGFQLGFPSSFFCVYLLRNCAAKSSKLVFDYSIVYPGNTVNSQIRPPGVLFVCWTLEWRLLRGGLKLVGHIPCDIILYSTNKLFFDATNASKSQW